MVYHDIKDFQKFSAHFSLLRFLIDYQSNKLIEILKFLMPLLTMNLTILPSNSFTNKVSDSDKPNNSIWIDDLEREGRRFSFQLLKLNQVNSSSTMENIENFHCAFKPIFRTAQWFGLFPISGVSSSKSSDLRFTVKSFKFAYCYLSIIGAAIHIVNSVRWLVTESIVTSEISSIIFYSTSMIIMLLLLRLARDWPDIAISWEMMEKESMSKYNSKTYNLTVATKFKIAGIIFISLGFAENLLYFLNRFFECLESVKMDEGSKEWNIITKFFSYTYPNIMTYDNCLWKGVLTFIVDNICSFTWNFMDFFIILLSIAITNQFQLLNQKLYSSKKRITNERWWSNLRTDYNRLAEMTQKIDSKISSIILLSFTSNLYFICMHLLNSFKPKSYLLEKIYFSYAFGFVILRTLAVAWFAANIPEESRSPASVLYSIPSENFSKEVERFLIQVTSTNLALTGMKFFSITRGLILTIASTIVTYEIVLVQFNALQENKLQINYTQFKNGF